MNCEECEGRGHIVGTCGSCNGSGEGMHETQTCFSCHGRGEKSYECEECGGCGTVCCQDCGKDLNLTECSVCGLMLCDGCLVGCCEEWN